MTYALGGYKHAMMNARQETKHKVKARTKAIHKEELLRVRDPNGERDYFMSTNRGLSLEATRSSYENPKRLGVKNWDIT